MSRRRRKKKEKQHPRGDAGLFLSHFGGASVPPPTGPFAESYKLAGYVDGLVGASPECEVLGPHWDSGLTWGDSNNIQPGDWLWDGGVAGGIPWDGSFHRDVARFGGRGPLFWCSYLKAGSVAGMQGGFWFNFGSGWSHLHDDDPAQVLSGASQRIFWDAGVWKLVIEATMFVSLEVVNVWSGSKGGDDPAGVYVRVSGLDPVASLTVEAV